MRKEPVLRTGATEEMGPLSWVCCSRKRLRRGSGPACGKGALCLAHWEIVRVRWRLQGSYGPSCSLHSSCQEPQLSSRVGPVGQRGSAWLGSSLRAPATHHGGTEAREGLRGPGKHFLFLSCITQHGPGYGAVTNKLRIFVFNYHLQIFLFNSFTEIYFTYRKIHPLKMYDPVVAQPSPF